MSEYRTFEDLDCWKAARLLRQDISSFLKELPLDEKFELKSQLRRSSRSISANIAEGYGRFHYQENIQFCRQARGSLTETLDHLILAFDEGYLTEERYSNFRTQLISCHRLLNGYISYLRKLKKEM